MSRKTSPVQALVLVLSISRMATATEPPALSLVEAQAEARAHSPDAREFEARVRGARRLADDAARVLRENPVLTVGYETGALSGETQESSLSGQLTWTVDLSGSWSTRREAAQADVARITFDREDGLRVLDEGVAVAVAELADAQRSTARLVRIAALDELGASAMHRKLDVGQGDQLEVDAADLDLAAGRADVAKARGSVAVARLALARLLGRRDDGPLEVQDATEPMDLPSEVEVDLVTRRDPRVRAKEAELRAARFELRTAERTAWPAPTLGAAYAFRRREVPLGALSGPGAAGLSAAWSDQELAVSLAWPLPLFDRQQQATAKANGHIDEADAALSATALDVRTELLAARAALRSARDAYAELASAPAILEREFALLEQAVRAGALDAVTQAQSIHRLLEAGARYDGALLTLRMARAHWERLARP